MRFLIPLFFLLTVSSTTYSQTGWESWNENYHEVNVTDLLNYEKIYADSVDRGLIEGGYYMRMETFRFPARYAALSLIEIES
jgi:hypothetical protein